MFSVNPSPKESRLSVMGEPPVLRTWRLDRETTSEKASESAVRPSLSLSAILRQRVWWLFLIAAAGALLFETLWTAMRTESV